jgi:hypothetical protein
MAKKIIVHRPWATKRGGALIIKVDSLIEATKLAQSVKFDKITVASRELRSLLQLMPTEHVKVTINGRLEIETVKCKYTKGKASYRRPRHVYNMFGLEDGAWTKPHTRVNPVHIKPKYF